MKYLRKNIACGCKKFIRLLMMLQRILIHGKQQISMHIIEWICVIIKELLTLNPMVKGIIFAQ